VTSPHDINNVMAGLLVNLDLVSEALANESPEAPLLESASPSERQDVLTAVTFAMISCRKLADILREQNERL